MRQPISIAVCLVLATTGAWAERPSRPKGQTYDTVVVLETTVLRSEGTGEAVDITIRKGDRLEFRALTEEGWVVRLFSSTDWVLPKEAGAREEQFKPKPLDVIQRKELFFRLKAVQEKAKAEAPGKEEREIFMDAACVEIFRATGQPTAVQREVLVLGLSQGW